MVITHTFVNIYILLISLCLTLLFVVIVTHNVSIDFANHSSLIIMWFIWDWITPKIEASDYHTPIRTGYFLPLLSTNIIFLQVIVAKYVVVAILCSDAPQNVIVNFESYHIVWRFGWGVYQIRIIPLVQGTWKLNLEDKTIYNKPVSIAFPYFNIENYRGLWTT